MAIDGLGTFNLGGGTGLALQLGHRMSYDLDFFGSNSIAIEDIITSLHADFQFQEMHRTQNILVLDINDIKVDFVKYGYALIENVKQEKSIRLLSIEDIAAMKLDAIKGRGRKRDFYDVYFLLKNFSLTYLLELHEKKYQQNNRFLILKSLAYFEDAEQDAPIRLLNEDITWNEVKTTISRYISKI